jgi:hypothetical protein
MLTSKENSSAKATAKLDLATTIAALSLFAATFIGADVVPVQSASSSSSSARVPQVQILRECDEGLDYGRLDSFEGMRSNDACV